MANEITQLLTVERVSSPVDTAPVATKLQIEFASESAAHDYIIAFTSLLYGTAETCLTIDETGCNRDDLDLAEIAQYVNTKRKQILCFRLPFEEQSHQITIALDGETKELVSVRGPFLLDRNATGILWLQADSQFLGPLPVLALPIQGSSFSFDALHALVALGVRVGGFMGAELYINNELQTRCKWSIDAPMDGGIPIVGSQEETVWSVANDVDSSSSPIAWCVISLISPKVIPLSADWWTRFDDLIRAAPTSINELEDHLRPLLPPEVRWRLGDVVLTRQAEFMCPVEDGLILALLPMATEVILAIDLHLPVDLLQTALLHAIAHLALYHVQPGDKWGHWDTSNTATTPEPHRQWDREVRDYVAERFRRPIERRINSIEDCTPTEKAQLGLWRMIGEMIGESRRLHHAAERYQKAAYQRQAAQRMVAMLEDYGGAMLCDGVGLGKTYVATTLMVHYANSWRDQWAATPDKLLNDPFRISVLAPNSVVSTWRREALPGLASFGVPLSTVRVISHTKLSRISRASELLETVRGGLSDLEHLLLSDLVIVDEAHNFRSLAARRTKVLRDLLRLQPRRELRRKVALLTATPVNNSLDDLRQEVSLLFSRPLWLSEAKTDDGYRRQAIKEVQDRCAKARNVRSRGDIASLVIHGQPDAKFSDTIEFRDDLDFGPNVQRIGDYLKEQDQRLKELQESIRKSVQTEASWDDTGVTARIAEDLLDRIVVQRSRALCKQIERQQASNIELLFRPDAEVPEKLYYSDEYDGIEDVLARFISLFDGDNENYGRSKTSPLSLKIYMWYDLREGIKKADELSPVVGLQRVLVLKRLESSPVSFLITLLRLLVLHAHRLQQLENLCLDSRENGRHQQLQGEIKTILDQEKKNALEKVRLLATGESPADPGKDFIKSLSTAYTTDGVSINTDDLPLQFSLFDDEETGLKREQLDRLWTLREAIITDFKTLLSVTPELADIIFGKFERSEWPRRFIAGGDAIDWPRSAAWGLRLVTDAKLRQLVNRLILARRAHQKVIVFSQFSDTIAYIQSVLKACANFSRNEWQMVVRGGLGVANLQSQELIELLASTATITGDTEDRDEVVNAFAPFYRIGPWRPVVDDASELERNQLIDNWEMSWTGAMARPIDVLLSSDVLAEGVNLQDAAMLINFDVHWNPVRMIQRSGRIDRRLNSRIEKPNRFPDLAVLAARHSKTPPRYYWHDHPDEAPLIVNMILPDELEAELQLRERIAIKTMTIDFTLGLEQGTGAEAEWMENYKYHGITSLNSFQKDRAIEQIANHHEKLSRKFSELGVRSEWAENLNGWFRATEADQGSPLIGRALLGRRGGELERFSRYLEPAVVDSVPYWFWAEKRPGESMFDGWLVLDGQPENFPPHPRQDIPCHENVSTPVKASHLLAASDYLTRKSSMVALSPREIGRPLMQGGSALAAPKLGSEEDRRLIAIRDFFILQLPNFNPEQIEQNIPSSNFSKIVRRGTSRICSTCGHEPGMHKCCMHCGASAHGEEAIEHIFGFRTMSDSRGESYEIPQPWCRSCRSSALNTSISQREMRDDRADHIE
ncbi:MAG: DEAD/DEAH box helicase [Acidobacteriota bacterium]